MNQERRVRQLPRRLFLKVSIMRICEACQREGEPVNHNGRGLRCPYCWELLPRVEAAPVETAATETTPAAEDAGESAEVEAAPVETAAGKRKKK